jgi:hypothetical protein
VLGACWHVQVAPGSQHTANQASTPFQDVQQALRIVHKAQEEYVESPDVAHYFSDSTSDESM